MTETVGGDRYPFSPRIWMLRGILANLGPMTPLPLAHQILDEGARIQTASRSTWTLPDVPAFLEIRQESIPDTTWSPILGGRL
jgi:hypothetical protein